MAGELGMERMRFLLGGQPAHKMTTLLGFMYDAHAIGNWCVEDWCKVVDRASVEVRWQHRGNGGTVVYLSSSWCRSGCSGCGCGCG